MRNTTLLFLIKKNADGFITDICLAMKKRGFGKGRYNGVGGKVEEGESIEDGARREAMEEIHVSVSALEKVGELSFTFPHESTFDQLVHVYFSDTWNGEEVESEEMDPSWFPVSKIPYKDMWPDDIYWLPRVLTGEKVRGRFVFAPGDVVEEYNIETL